jgi:flagellar basal-body rod modification protein FlgD
MSMMDGINGTSESTGTQATRDQGSSGLGLMDGDDFLKLFVAQLTNQNPMEPMDATQMMAQTAQFTTVESLQKISEYQQHIMGYSQMSTATALIGRTVEALAADGTRVTGVVGDVAVTADGPVLSIGDDDIPLVNLIKVVAGGTDTSNSSTGSTDGTGSTDTGTTGEDHAGTTA